METNLNLEPSALEAAERVARHEQISLDDAVSKLILLAAGFQNEVAAGFAQLGRGGHVELDRETSFAAIRHN